MYNQQYYPTQQYPTTWNLISTPVRTCGRSSTTSTSCDSAVFPSGGHSYQQVCGRILAYQIGDPGAFVGAVRDGRNSIEQQYMTGLSLTHGAAGVRQHIWSFAAYTIQRSAGDFTRSCDCANPSQDWPYQSLIDSFVGNDYFCEYTYYITYCLLLTFHHIGVGSKLRVGGYSLTSRPLHTPQCASARSISTMYNQPYARKRKFSKRKPSILRPKIDRSIDNF